MLPELPRPRAAIPARDLRIRLTRTSPTHHRMEFVRSDGTGESCDLETRSCLLHDLVHFAVESEAGLSDSFFGRLAQGVSYPSLAHTHQDETSAIGLVATERVVGPLQGAWKAGLDPRAFVARFAAYQEAVGEPCPTWLDEALLVRVAKLLQRLEGQWRATPFGDTMELTFRATAATARPCPPDEE
jgi:hypothetical protein